MFFWFLLCGGVMFIYPYFQSIRLCSVWMSSTGSAFITQTIKNVNSTIEHPLLNKRATINKESTLVTTDQVSVFHFQCIRFLINDIITYGHIFIYKISNWKTNRMATLYSFEIGILTKIGHRMYKCKNLLNWLTLLEIWQSKPPAHNTLSGHFYMYISTIECNPIRLFCHKVYFCDVCNVQFYLTLS